MTRHEYDPTRQEYDPIELIIFNSLISAQGAIYWSLWWLAGEFMYQHCGLCPFLRTWWRVLDSCQRERFLLLWHGSIAISKEQRTWTKGAIFAPSLRWCFPNEYWNLTQAWLLQFFAQFCKQTSAFSPYGKLPNSRNRSQTLFYATASHRFTW